MTRKRIELLAPGGDPDSIKAAVLAGADAIFCGLHKFNARNRATNILFKDLNGILRFAHGHDCRVYLTLNIILEETDFPELTGFLNKLSNTNIDGIIVQDFGLFYLLSRNYPRLKIHASTQLTTHNAGQIEFLSKLTATRVNLSRELNIEEISALTRVAHNRGLSTEVFVHGSYCLSFSGICYISSVHSANSGNRGRCSQPCRDRYLTTPQGKEFPLNLKDNSAFGDLKILDQAGVDALKIEGRVKESHYVYTVTNAWKEQLQSFYDRNQQANGSSDLYKVFNRGFSNAYLAGDIHRSMFTDQPRNHAAEHLRHIADDAGDADSIRATEASYDEIAKNRHYVARLIEQASIAKAPITIRISGQLGTPLCARVITPETSYEVFSEARLAPQSVESKTQHLSHEMFTERLKAVGESEYYIEHLELDNLQSGLFVPFKEVTSMKRKILFLLRGKQEPFAPLAVPVVENHHDVNSEATVSVLLSSKEDLPQCSESGADLYFQLPSGLRNERDELVSLFTENKGLTPWFPSVLIGEDYEAAIEFLRQVRPGRIVTNNTGVAFEASRARIPWIAGPTLNIANSFSLLCLKERFDCHGAFLSNELGQQQIKRIKAPLDFKLYYRIYHPIALLTSRQCLFHQVTGCEKSTFDDQCVRQCEKSASITNHKGVSLHLKKTKGNYCTIYHERHFLNVDIVADVPGLISSYFVDLRNLRTETQLALDKSRTIRLFEDHVTKKEGSLLELMRHIQPTTDAPYRRGF